MRKSKYVICGILIGLLMSLGTVIYAAGGVTETIEIMKNSVNVAVGEETVGSIGDDYSLANGEQVPFSFVYKGTTYLPIRKVAELLDKDVTWDGNTKTVGLADKVTETVSKTEDNLLYEDEKIRITYYSFEENNYDGHTVTFMIENKTDIVLTVQCDAIAIDKYSMDNAIMSSEIIGNSMGKAEAKFMEKFLVDSPTLISGQFRIIDMNSDNWDTFEINFNDITLN